MASSLDSPTIEGLLELAATPLPASFSATSHGGRLSTAIVYACIVFVACLHVPGFCSEPKSRGLVVCPSRKIATVYRPRQPRQSPLYQLIERYYPEFERTYDEHYQQRYGPWRPIIGEVARKFLRCGDLHFGFARVRCTSCGHDSLVELRRHQIPWCDARNDRRLSVPTSSLFERPTARGAQPEHRKRTPEPLLTGRVDWGP